jgi:Tol biopolymer transport system component
VGPPPPFGAAGGLIAYSKGGDIFLLDPRSGALTPVLVGPEVDRGPEFSVDGRHLMFEREIDGQPWLYIANADGTGAHPLLDQPTVGVLSGSWTPDGRVLMAHEVNGHQRVSFFAVDGSGSTTPNLGMEATWPQLRPPSFQDLLVRGVKDGRIDLYLVGVDGGTPRPLGLPSPQLFGADWDLWDPSFRSDGSAFAYLTVDPADNDEHGQFRIHLYDMDARTDRVISRTGPTIQEAWPYWAPNGEHIAIQRWEWKGTNRVAIIPADGHDEGFEVDVGTPFDRQPTSAWISTWSPDSTQVLAWMDSTEAPILIDVAAGTFTRPDWRFDEPPSWAAISR